MWHADHNHTPWGAVIGQVPYELNGIRDVLEGGDATDDVPALVTTSSDIFNMKMLLGELSGFNVDLLYCCVLDTVFRTKLVR